MGLLLVWRSCSPICRELRNMFWNSLEYIEGVGTIFEPPWASGFLEEIFGFFLETIPPVWNPSPCRMSRWRAESLPGCPGLSQFLIHQSAASWALEKVILFQVGPGSPGSLSAYLICSRQSVQLSPKACLNAAFLGPFHWKSPTELPPSPKIVGFSELSLMALARYTNRKLNRNIEWDDT